MDEFERLRKEYLAELPQKVERAQAEVQKVMQALAELEKISHKLAGSAGTYGFPELSKLAVEMENHITEGSVNRKILKDWIGRFLAETTAMRKAS